MAAPQGSPDIIRITMVLSYDGTAYYGYQQQEGVPTVEGALLDGLRELGITPQPGTMSRAARTDKGVSAVCNVVNFTTTGSSKQLMTRLNASLPAHLRVQQLRLHAMHLPPFTSDVSSQSARVHFDARRSCQSRSYLYLLPVWTLRVPPAHTTTPSDPAVQVFHPLQPSEQELLSDVLSGFVGRHSFHNFCKTRKCIGEDPWRTILEFKIADASHPLSSTANQVQHVMLSLQGSSFMMHQIRKMVGLVLAVVRGAAPLACIQHALTPGMRVVVPTAPARGLVMEHATYLTAPPGTLVTCLPPGNDHTLSTAAVTAQQQPGPGHQSVPTVSESPPHLWSSCDTGQAYGWAQHHILPSITTTTSDEMTRFVASLNEATFKFHSWAQLAADADVLERVEGGAKARRCRVVGGSAAVVVGSQETYGVDRSSWYTPKGHEKATQASGCCV